MFDTEAYLKKLGYSGSLEPTPELLRILHKLHLMKVPFDNSLNAGRGLDIWEYVDIDVDETFDAVVTGGRGGVCHELSGLFRNLLTRLGFDVSVMAAGVRMADGAFGPELEHMFHVVRFGEERWLVDVGFAGPSFLEPLRLAGGEQEQYGCTYRLDEQEGYWTLNRRPHEGAWEPVYRFPDVVRELSEWRGEPSLREYARELNTAVTLIRGRAFDTGQLTLIGKRLITVAGGRQKIRVLVKPADYENAVSTILLPEF
ncbi:MULTISPECIES: arylamine N-acetyltransferase [unclassified Streptomyces]|uniref:arylamine N-acetyltransferase family protein n=1 Tax=unclassified Streptomyces TaxID=2593676 RepID=UPI0033BC770F